LNNIGIEADDLKHSRHLNTLPANPQTRDTVAVIVPCYNAERHLERALDSAIRQTYANLRIYAVDDGSTDRTLQILESHSDRCSFLSRQRAGPAAARNSAIRMSDSTFVAFLDADDEWLPLKLERQVALLKQDSTLGLVCCGCAVRGEGTTRPFLSGRRASPLSGRLFRRLVRECFIFTPTVVVRRRCLEEVGLFNESLPVSEDFNLWLRIAARWKIAFSPEALAVTHQRSESLSASIPAEVRLRTGVAALEHVQGVCPEITSAERRALRVALAERHYFHGSFLLSTGDKEASRRSLSSALKLQPTHWRALAKLGLGFLPGDAARSLAGFKRKLAQH
jgi:Glycosyl transferase family 2